VFSHGDLYLTLQTSY